MPVSAANMDTTGVFDVAKVLQSHNMMTCIQKFYSVKDLERAWADGVDARYVAVTCGSTEDSFPAPEEEISNKRRVVDDMHRRRQWISGGFS